MLLILSLLAYTNYAALAYHSCNFSIPTIGLSTGTRVLYPNNPEWHNDTVRWAEYKPPTYFVSVRPALESDVQALVCPIILDWPRSK